MAERQLRWIFKGQEKQKTNDKVDNSSRNVYSDMAMIIKKEDETSYENHEPTTGSSDDDEDDDCDDDDDEIGVVHSGDGHSDVDTETDDDDCDKPDNHSLFVKGPTHDDSDSSSNEFDADEGPNRLIPEGERFKKRARYDETNIKEENRNDSLVLENLASMPNYTNLDPFDYQLLFGPKTKRRRTEITPKMKRDICLYKEEHPEATSGDIAFHFERTLSLKMGRTTLWDILKNKDKWLNIVSPDGTTRIRAPKYLEMERELFNWFTNMRWRNIAVTDEMLRNRAQRFGEDLGEVPNSFKYSAGWLQRFKHRFGISLKTSCKSPTKSSGEPAFLDSPNHAQPSTSSNSSSSSHFESIQAQKTAKLNDLLKAFNPNNIFRFLELGLLYRKEPLSVPASNSYSLDRKNTDHVTLALCTNLTGALKVKPIIVWYHARPHCFGQEFDPEMLVHWRSDEKAVMNVAIFTEWVRSFDWQMRLQNRKVLLLVDDTLWHKIGFELNNVQLCPLSVTYAAKLLALDSGLSSTFKAIYRKYLLSQYLQLSEDGHAEDINIKQAIYLIRDSWRDVKPQIIANCWLRTGIPLQQSPGNNPIVPKHDMDEILQDLSKLIRNMPNARGFRLLTAAEFVVVDSKLETGKVLTQEDIINMALQQMGQTPSVEAGGGDDVNARDETLPPPRISLIEATRGLDFTLTFIEQNVASGLFSVEDIDNIRDIMKKLLQHNINRYKEASLISFFVQSQTKDHAPISS